MKLKLDMSCHLLNAYTKFQIDISKHVEKKSGKLGRTDGRTDGQTDGHCHSIIRPFFKRAYKNTKTSWISFWNKKSFTWAVKEFLPTTIYRCHVSPCMWPRGVLPQGWWHKWEHGQRARKWKQSTGDESHINPFPPWTKWPPFRKRYFQVHFLEWKVL